MYIESIELKNYRNYEYLYIELDPPPISFTGTTPRERRIFWRPRICAVPPSLTGKQGPGDHPVWPGGIPYPHDGATGRISRKIDVHLKKNKSKGIAVDGIPIKKASELFGIVNLVFFSPEDLNIIKNGPGERRRFLDMELCQLDKIYLQDLAGYNQVLNQRNKLLKDISFSPRLADTLDVWDMQLVHYGKKIIAARKRFIGELNGMIRELHASLTGGRESIYLNYEPNVEEELLEERLAASRDRDLKFKQSSVGPHRDDFCVQVNDIDIRKFGSQGQQRTAALSLKLSELALVKKRIGENPVLLLDDVLSELDSSRQNYLLQSIHQIQTLITCTGLDEFVSNRFEINKIFRVIDGNVFKNNDEK